MPRHGPWGSFWASEYAYVILSTGLRIPRQARIEADMQGANANAVSPITESEGIPAPVLERRSRCRAAPLRRRMHDSTLRFDDGRRGLLEQNGKGGASRESNPRSAVSGAWRRRNRSTAGLLLSAPIEATIHALIGDNEPHHCFRW